MEKQTEFSWRNLKERRDIDDIGAATIVILKRILSE